MKLVFIAIVVLLVLVGFKQFQYEPYTDSINNCFDSSLPYIVYNYDRKLCFYGNDLNNTTPTMRSFLDGTKICEIHPNHYNVTLYDGRFNLPTTYTDTTEVLCNPTKIKITKS